MSHMLLRGQLMEGDGVGYGERILVVLNELEQTAENLLEAQDRIRALEDHEGQRNQLAERIKNMANKLILS